MRGNRGSSRNESTNGSATIDVTCNVVFAYRPRRHGVGGLYRIVHEHLETFCAQAASLRGGEGLPRFADEAFRAYLPCGPSTLLRTVPSESRDGWLAARFARFRCAACGTDRLGAFSCKGRGFCPSCGARRLTALTAHLTTNSRPDTRGAWSACADTPCGRRSPKISCWSRPTSTSPYA
jgi:hypothetical protein